MGLYVALKLLISHDLTHLLGFRLEIMESAESRQDYDKKDAYSAEIRHLERRILLW